jgi:hypothetical protein
LRAPCSSSAATRSWSSRTASMPWNGEEVQAGRRAHGYRASEGRWHHRAQDVAR